MSTQEAIEELRDLQGQIIHGSNTFGDIAEVVTALRAKCERLELALNEIRKKVRNGTTYGLAGRVDDIAREALAQPDQS